MPPPPATLPQFTLTHKTCLVTGGARGLGHEFLLAFALSGASTLICIDLHMPEIEASFEKIREELKAAASDPSSPSSSPRTLGYECNVADEDSVGRVWGEITRDLGEGEGNGGVHVVVTAAGIVGGGVPALDVDVRDWRRVMDINLTGSFLFAQHAARNMIANNVVSGSIIFISSMSALIVNRPQPQAAYNASKAAISHLTRTLSTEWAPHNIRVNALCPGYQHTPLLQALLDSPQGKSWSEQWIRDTPMGRLGDPQELRGPIVFLASEASKFMTGQNLVVDGGFTAW
ncbi:short-chain dehydrogenase/reductase-like protein SDR [Peziza echinospora]|nr:short-chain dehydrogenase/reductase-like protein SDR [Peziza echinospora]